MGGLTDMAGGTQFEVDEAIKRARASWEASMLRQVDAMRAVLAQDTPAALALRSGATYVDGCLLLPYWEMRINLSWPALKATCLPNGSDCSTFDTAMLVYYLHTADGSPMADRWIGFRELPDGAFYNQAFQGYSGDRIAGAFGDDPETFHEAARGLGGWQLPALADYAYAFQPFPRIRLAAVLWPGDEDFPSKSSVLFDAAASHYMTTDGLALLGSGLAHRLLRARGG
jgi:hypothetical protein